MALNNELIFSFIDDKNKVTTYLFSDISNATSFINIGGSNIQSTKNGVIPKITIGRKSNYNPNNSDPYGYNSNYRLEYSNFHTINLIDTSSSIDISTITIEPIYYMGAVICTTMRTRRVDSSEDYTQYKTSTTKYLYDTINDTYTPKIVQNNTFHAIQGSGHLSYVLSIDTAKNFKRKKFPTKVHSNFVPDFGNYTTVEDNKNGNFVVDFTSSNIGNFVPKYGKVSLKLNSTTYLNVNMRNLFSARYGMDTSMKVYNATHYAFTTEWDNKVYKNITGTSLESEGFIISGVLAVKLYGINNVLLHEQSFNAYSNEFSHFETIPNFYRTSSDTPISGYVNLNWVKVNLSSDDSLTRSEIVYRDEFNRWQNFKIPQGGRLNFRKNHKHLNGKVLKIKAYYKTISNDVKSYSNTLCSAYRNYFDIDDVSLVMSGVRYNPITSGTVGYTDAYMDEDSGTININKIGQKFQTIASGWANVNFTLNTNETDIYDNIRLKSPAPSGIYLLAIPITSKNDVDVKRLCLQIPSNRVLNRGTINKQSLFPSINTSGGEEIITLCTGSPNTPTAKGIMWNTQNTIPVYDAPETGEFLTNTYTINVLLYHNSFMFYLVIEDSESNYSCYCISNPPTFDMPTIDKFQS